MWNAFFPARPLALADALRVVAEYGGVKAILPLAPIPFEPNTSFLTVSETVCYEEPCGVICPCEQRPRTPDSYDKRPFSADSPTMHTAWQCCS